MDLKCDERHLIRTLLRESMEGVRMQHYKPKIYTKIMQIFHFFFPGTCAHINE